MRGKALDIGSMDAPFILASMRPPRNAGESPLAMCYTSIGMIASMRPPRNAGESAQFERDTDDFNVLQ